MSLPATISRDVLIARMELRVQLDNLNNFATWATPQQVAEVADLVAEKARVLHDAERCARRRQLDFEFLNREAAFQSSLVLR